MVLGAPRWYCVILFIAILTLLIGAVGCGGGAAASTNPGGGTNPPQSADLAITPNSVDFAEQTVNTTSNAQTVTLRNPGTTTLGISSIMVDGDFTQSNNCGSSIPASSTCAVAVVFGPASTGALTGTLQIAETSGRSHRVPIRGSGTAGHLAATPTSIDFGSVGTGQSSTQNLKLTNVGGANVTISSFTTASAGFSVSGPTVPLVLPKGASTILAVTFSPSSAGSASGSIAVANSASTTPFTVAMVGSGVAPGQLAANATKLDFGSVTVGQSSTRTVTVTNTGGAAVTVSSVVANGTGFSVSGVTVPFTIAPNASSNVNVVFTPTSGSSITGGLYIRNSAATAPLTLGLAGKGVATGQLIANPTSIDFGSVKTGQSSSRTVTLSNTGAASLTISAVTTNGVGFSSSSVTVPLTLAPGANTTFNVTFSPSSTANATGSVSVANSVSSQPLTIPLTGATGAQITANAASLDFGSVTVGQSGVRTVIISNPGSSSVTVSSVQASGTGFSATSTTAPFTMAPGTNSTITVTFAPTGIGSVSGGLYIRNSTSTTPLTVGLKGVAVATTQLSATPTSVGFGNVSVGQSSTKTVTLSNTGTASLTITGLSTDGPGFSASLSVPLTLAVGASTSFSVMFSPSNSGTASGHAYVSDSVRAQDVTIPLSGTAVPAASHTVSLSWIGSTSTVVGYNVYRGTQPGGPYTRINTTTQNLTSYADAAVQNGSTYYYVVTAVDQDSAESAFSNEASALVPTT